MYSEERPGNGRSRPRAVHPSTSTENARKSNNGEQNGGVAFSGGNHPVELSEIPKWDPIVEAIPPTPGMRRGTDGEQRKNKERINDKTMIQSW